MAALVRICPLHRLSARQRMARIDRRLGKVEARLTAALNRLDALRMRAAQAR